MKRKELELEAYAWVHAASDAQQLDADSMDAQSPDAKLDLKDSLIPRPVMSSAQALDAESQDAESQDA